MSQAARKRYEVLLLAVPEISADDSAKIEKSFVKLVEDSQGELLSFERWGKYRLAYPVQKNDYGVYFLARFEFAAEQAQQILDAMKQFFQIKHNDKIMRHMFTLLDLDASLEYERPISLEEAPKREMRPAGRPGNRSTRPSATVEDDSDEDDVQEDTEELA